MNIIRKFMKLCNESNFCRKSTRNGILILRFKVHMKRNFTLQYVNKSIVNVIVLQTKNFVMILLLKAQVLLKWSGEWD